MYAPKQEGHTFPPLTRSNPSRQKDLISQNNQLTQSEMFGNKRPSTATSKVSESYPAKRGSSVQPSSADRRRGDLSNEVGGSRRDPAVLVGGQVKTESTDDETSHNQSHLPEISSLFLAWPAKDPPFPNVCDLDSLPDPQDSNSLPPLAIKWRLPKQWLEQREEGRVRSDLRQQLRQAGVMQPERLAITFPTNTGRGCHMIMGCITNEQFKQVLNTKLAIGGQDCVVVCKCPGWVKDHAVLKLCDLDPAIDQTRLLARLRKILSELMTIKQFLLQVTQAAKTGENGLPVAYGRRTFTGIAWIIGKYEPTFGPHDLPSWILFDGPKLPLFFKGRGNPCPRCKYTAVPSHQFEDCPKRLSK